MKDPEVFDGKSLSHLLQDVFNHAERKRTILYEVVKEMRLMMIDMDSMVMLAPMVKEYLDVLNRNDEHLIKMATIVQRIIAANSGGGDTGDTLSAAEREALLRDYKAELDDEVKKIEDKLVITPKPILPPLKDVRT